MATTFLPEYRKASHPEQTHFCPGCGHGNILKWVDEAIADVASETIWVSPVGCGGLTDSYLSISHVLAAHGRASAVATAIKRANPDALVIASQGDGDLASIGLLEALHAANRGENITVLFINNANFGMTGGQMAPTTLCGQTTVTCPHGRCEAEHGAPIRVCELLDRLDGPAFIARVAIGTERQILEARRVVKRAIDNQRQGRGYSFVEILSPCPSNWHCSPVEARDRVAQEMIRTFPTGIVRDISREDWVRARQRPSAYDPERVRAPFEALCKPVEVCHGAHCELPLPMSLCCAGFGGQGVMTFGHRVAELALSLGYEATWIPSYGPEMRGGAANCFVRMDARRIASPVVDRPSVLVAMNQPAWDKFVPSVAEHGVALYDSDSVEPLHPVSDSVRHLGIPATSLAMSQNAPRSANMVLLGAFLALAFDVETAHLLALNAEQRRACEAGFSYLTHLQGGPAAYRPRR